MHTALLPFAAMLLATCMSATVRAQQPSVAELEVRAVEERWLANESRPEVVASILADDFVHVLPVGFIDKNEHLQYLKQHPGAFPGARHFGQLRVRIYGDTAVVTARADVKGHQMGEDFSGPYRYTRVWVRRTGHWQAVSYQATVTQ